MKFLISGKVCLALLLPLGAALLLMSSPSTPGLTETYWGQLTTPPDAEPAPPPPPLPTDRPLTLEEGAQSDLLVPGLAGKIYRGLNYEKSPIVKALVCDDMGLLIDPQSLPVDGTFSAVFEGYIKIEKADRYIFSTVSDDGSFLILNGQQIVDNGGEHAPIEVASRPTMLQPGFHPFTLKYYNTAYGGMLALKMSPAGKRPEIAPATQVFYKLDESLIPKGKSRLPVASRNVANIHYLTDKALAEQYYRHWPRDEQDFPSDKLVALDVEWTGYIFCPEDGDYVFQIPELWNCELTVGETRRQGLGPSLKSHKFSCKAGWQKFSLKARKPLDKRGLTFEWKIPGAEEFSVVTPLHFSHTNHAPKRTAAEWTWLILGIAFAAGGLVWIGVVSKRGRTEWAAVWRTIKHDAPRLAFIIIVVWAGFLRTHNIGAVPAFLETEDEYQFIWSGFHLLKDGSPQSWTAGHSLGYLRDKIVEERKWWGHPFTITNPWFDNPPLMSLLAGIPPWAAGIENRWEIYPAASRMVCVLLSLLCLPMIYWLARRWGGTGAAVLACLIYAITPSFVIGSRVVKPEILMSVWFLLMVCLVEVNRDHPRKWWVALLTGVACGLAFWTKVLGIAALPAAVIAYAGLRQWRNMFVMIAGGLLVGGMLFVYGWLYDFDTFMKVCFLGQSGKNLGMIIIRTLFTSPHHIWTNDVLGFGWVFFLWLAMFKGLGRMALAAQAIFAMYFIALLGSTDSVFFFGWYRIPFDPLLSVACGLVLVKMWNKAPLHWYVLFGIMLLLGALIIAYPEFEQPTKFRVGILALMVPLFALYMLQPYKIGQKALRGLLILWLAAAVFLSYRIVIMFELLT